MSRRIHGQRKAVSAKKLKKSNAHHKATRKMLQSGEDGGMINPPVEKYDPGSNWEFVKIGDDMFKYWPDLNLLREY